MTPHSGKSIIGGCDITINVNRFAQLRNLGAIHLKEEVFSDIEAVPDHDIKRERPWVQKLRGGI